MNRIAITKINRNNREYLSYILMDNMRNVLDLSIFEPDQLTYIGKIFVGRVENILPSINAVFVRISPDTNCFLPMSEAKNPIYVRKPSKKEGLCIGDEILVQITKDAVKTKDAVASTNLTLHGKFAALTTSNKTLSVSKKLDNEKREAYKALLKGLVEENENKDFGIVLRTNSKDADTKTISADIKALMDRYKQVIEKAKHAALYSLIDSPNPSYFEKIKEANLENVDIIYSDSKEICTYLKENLSSVNDKVSYYEDNMVSLKTLYNIERLLDEVLSSKVLLKSGANIIIEQLETLTFIDINSSKNVSKNKSSALDINKEAAGEIIRQLRLRNISGMILVDFINMNKEDSKELITYLKKLIARESGGRLTYIDMTGLGLVELTRKKQRKSLKEIVKTY